MTPFVFASTVNLPKSTLVAWLYGYVLVPPSVQTEDSPPVAAIETVHVSVAVGLLTLIFCDEVPSIPELFPAVKENAKAPNETDGLGTASPAASTIAILNEAALIVWLNVVVTVVAAYAVPNVIETKIAKETTINEILFIFDLKADSIFWQFKLFCFT